MLSKFIAPGNRIELQAAERAKSGASDEAQKVYYSQVYDIISEDQLEITMPMEQTKLILLPLDEEFDLVFYGNGGLYQCTAIISDRYKSNNVYILLVDLTSELRKYQRREYYRFNCALETGVRFLNQEEIKLVEEKKPYVPAEGELTKRGVIVDISGGGLRFMCTQLFEQDAQLYCCFHLAVGDKKRKYEIAARVLNVKELENRSGTYEHRVKYVDMDEDVREEIIRFIFEAERKSIKRERRN